MVPELEAYRASLTDGANPSSYTLQALDLLIRTVKESYRSVTKRLEAHLAEGKVPYDLLWALFKAKDYVFTVCHGSRKPRCVRYDFGQEKATNQGVKYFELQCRSFDFDGNVFGEVVETFTIEKFYGVKRIDALEAFPLAYHTSKGQVVKYLIERGQKFISMLRPCHVYYQGNAFFQNQRGVVRVPIDSRIMIDADQFRKCNPNYHRLYIKKPGSRDFGLWDDISQPDQERIRTTGVEPEKMQENDLMICPATALGFSLGGKVWGEFSIDNIREIEWFTVPFEPLTISEEKKEILVAVAQSRMGEEPGAMVDDFVEGKGRGLISLLHGPPGVGKTLTAEAISEHFQRPLYPVSAGELDPNPTLMEMELAQIFQTAAAWKALLLFDEADFFF